MTKAGKYAFYSEVKDWSNTKKACVIYHHLCCNGSHDEQIQNRICDLKEKVKPSRKVFAIKFNAYSPRVYFILSDNDEADRIQQKLENLCKFPFFENS
jgi:hypothetical protein